MCIRDRPYGGSGGDGRNTAVLTEEDNRTVVLELIEKRRRRIMEQLRRENPDAASERLEEFLSLLIGHRVKDGSIANVEVQKVGYLFPGQRSACYSADLLLRQYKRVKSEKKKSFSYRSGREISLFSLYV